jgi:hypothetical protein
MNKLALIIFVGILGMIFSFNAETFFLASGQPLIENSNPSDQNNPTLTMSEMSNTTSMQASEMSNTTSMQANSTK